MQQTGGPQYKALAEEPACTLAGFHLELGFRVVVGYPRKMLFLGGGWGGGYLFRMLRMGFLFRALFLWGVCLRTLFMGCLLRTLTVGYLFRTLCGVLSLDIIFSSI